MSGRSDAPSRGEIKQRLDKALLALEDATFARRSDPEVAKELPRLRNDVASLEREFYDFEGAERARVRRADEEATQRFAQVREEAYASVEEGLARIVELGKELEVATDLAYRITGRIREEEDRFRALLVPLADRAKRGLLDSRCHLIDDRDIGGVFSARGFERLVDHQTPVKDLGAVLRLNGERLLSLAREALQMGGRK